MPKSKQQRDYDRARRLETLIDVKSKTRDNAVAKALEHARIAAETHDERHVREAVKQRDFARWLDERINDNLLELSGLRGEL